MRLSTNAENIKLAIELDETVKSYPPLKVPNQLCIQAQEIAQALKDLKPAISQVREDTVSL